MTRLAALRSHRFSAGALTLSVHPGWIDIVERLYEGLERLGGDTRVRYLKEKYAELDIAVDAAPEIYGKAEMLTMQASGEAARTCQVCGRRGRLRVHGGWFAMLCDGHWDAWNVRGSLRSVTGTEVVGAEGRDAARVPVFVSVHHEEDNAYLDVYGAGWAVSMGAEGGGGRFGAWLTGLVGTDGEVFALDASQTSCEAAGHPDEVAKSLDAYFFRESARTFAVEDGMAFLASMAGGDVPQLPEEGNYDAWRLGHMWETLERKVIING